MLSSERSTRLIVACMAMLVLWAGFLCDYALCEPAEAEPQAKFDAKQVQAAIDSANKAAEQLKSELARIAGIFEVLSDEDKQAALNLVGSAGVRSPEALGILRTAQDFPDTKFIAICIAKELGYGEWLRWIEEAARDNDARTRRRAVTALGFLPGTDHLPLLLEMLDDPVATVRVSVPNAIMRVVRDSVLRAMMSKLRDDEEDAVFRIGIATSLMDMGAGGPHGEAYLKSVMEGDDQQMRQHAAFQWLFSGSVEALAVAVQELAQSGSNVENWQASTILEYRLNDDIIDKAAIRPYVKEGERVTIDDVRRWLDDNAGRVVWDPVTRKYTLKEEGLR